MTTLTLIASIILIVETTFVCVFALQTRSARRRAETARDVARHAADRAAASRAETDRVLNYLQQHRPPPTGGAHG